jgi:hypothetical protein
MFASGASGAYSTKKEKRVRKHLLVLLLVSSLLGCAFFQELKKVVPERRGSKPVIADSYAPRQVKPGEVWRIFLEAEDVDGDMQDIVSAIVPTTRSIYNYSFTPIKQEEAASFSGYLSVATPLSTYLVGEGFDVIIYIRDKAGNRGESVGFDLKFTSEAGGPFPEKWRIASENRLGQVFSDYLAQYERRLRFPGR